MAKVILLIAIILLFNGCERAMTAKEIDEAVKECEKYNLQAEYLSNMLVDGGFSVSKVRCGKRKK